MGKEIRIPVVISFCFALPNAAHPDSSAGSHQFVYFYATVEPGEHHLCVKGHRARWKGLSLHQLNAKTGETYYFVVHTVDAGGYIELTFMEVDSDEGKELIARSKFSSSQPK